MPQKMMMMMMSDDDDDDVPRTKNTTQTRKSESRKVSRLPQKDARLSKRRCLSFLRVSLSLVFFCGVLQREVCRPDDDDDDK